MQADLLRNAGGNNSHNVKETEDKMVVMIEKNNTIRDSIEENRARESHAKSPFGSLMNLNGRES